MENMPETKRFLTVSWAVPFPSGRTTARVRSSHAALRQLMPWILLLALAAAAEAAVLGGGAVIFVDATYNCDGTNWVATASPGRIFIGDDGTHSGGVNVPAVPSLSSSEDRQHTQYACTWLRIGAEI